MVGLLTIAIVLFLAATAMICKIIGGYITLCYHGLIAAIFCLVVIYLMMSSLKWTILTLIANAETITDIIVQHKSSDESQYNPDDYIRLYDLENTAYREGGKLITEHFINKHLRTKPYIMRGSKNSVYAPVKNLITENIKIPEGLTVYRHNNGSFITTNNTI